MTPDQLKAAAQVMLEAAKPGAIVEYACRGPGPVDWRNAPNPIWDWKLFNYRVTTLEPKHTTLDDLPPVCWVREIGVDECHLANAFDPVYGGGAIQVGTSWKPLPRLCGYYEYSADRKTWTPFS